MLNRSREDYHVVLAEDVAVGIEVKGFGIGDDRGDFSANVGDDAFAAAGGVRGLGVFESGGY